VTIYTQTRAIATRGRRAAAAAAAGGGSGGGARQRQRRDGGGECSKPSFREIDDLPRFVLVFDVDQAIEIGETDQHA
jgi:hypothetical protein